MNNNNPNMNNNSYINDLNNVYLLQSMLEVNENNNINNWYMPHQNYPENNLPLFPNSLTNFQTFDLDSPNLTLDSPLPTTHYENDLGFQSLGPLGINSSDHTNSDGSLDKSAPSYVTGESSGVGKGKKRMRNATPAKNLASEQRRRKKLNARLISLRTIVPKITKMDRASILADAIWYLKDLKHKINELSLELESIPSNSLASPATTAKEVYQLTQTANAGTSSIEGMGFQEPARIEVRQREGGVVNIHMFCNWKPGLLYSIIHGLDNLGLDIQQAIISSFNGFVLDVFRAKKCNENLDNDQIKAVLLESIEPQNVM
uniref:transcription factor SCREAM2-like n=1 Tax=Erigeron canadensis TaxID=72917 RepID=UPI001CB90656|nr:transcription factor SCREAM2-like [Erigeron canadensis]